MSTTQIPADENLHYRPLRGRRGTTRALVAIVGPCAGRRFLFHDRLEIGRWSPGDDAPEGTIWVRNPTVSRRHCVLTQDEGGRCWVRDVSRNGTHIDHHRLVPGAEVELTERQVLSVADGVSFRLAPREAPLGAGARISRPTVPVRAGIQVTVLAGDIRGYTSMVRECPGEELQESVNALFRALERTVSEMDGTVKEYPGDAILAYWEDAACESCAVRACQAALVLEQTARELAEDPSIWRLAERPLQMDWALATGEVLVDSLGGGHPVGLSVVGGAVVLATRLEKLAGEHTGSVLACGCTRERAAAAFLFRELGPMTVAGFDRPQPIFVLEGPR